MYQAKIENSSGNIMTLTGVEPTYQIISITGLNPPSAQINTTTIVGLDGAVFNSSKLQTRNLVLTVKINGNVEQNRLLLYSYFKTKDWCKFYYTNESLDVSIEGYVESVECDLFSNNELAQISILCPYPYFKSLSEILTDSSKSIPQFYFPFSINIGEPVVISTLDESSGIAVYNSSESETGVTVQINILYACNSIEIKNITTGDDFEINFSFLANETVIINTNKGQKSIKLIRAGVISNIFSALQSGSVFFQLAPGVNNFEYLVDNSAANNDEITITFRYYNIYRGV